MVKKILISTLTFVITTSPLGVFASNNKPMLDSKALMALLNQPNTLPQDESKRKYDAITPDEDGFIEIQEPKKAKSTDPRQLDHETKKEQYSSARNELYKFNTVFTDNLIPSTLTKSLESLVQLCIKFYAKTYTMHELIEENFPCKYFDLVDLKPRMYTQRLTVLEDLFKDLKPHFKVHNQKTTQEITKTLKYINDIKIADKKTSLTSLPIIKLAPFFYEPAQDVNNHHEKFNEDTFELLLQSDDDATSEDDASSLLLPS